MSLTATLHSETMAGKLLSGDDRPFLLRVLHFLLQDPDARRKTAYLSRFINPLELPAEYAFEESVAALLQQYGQMQTDFAQTYEQAIQMRRAASEIGDMKREIQQMEEEKQMVQNKIERTKGRVQDMVSAACRATEKGICSPHSLCAAST